MSWWKEGLPSEDEMVEGRRNLASTENKVDFIVTHCGAASSILLYSLGGYKPDILKKWFMGHYDDNYAVNDKEIIIYEQIVGIA